MNFASKNFFIFLPIVLLVYYLLATRSARYRFLLVASWIFYMSWNPRFLWVIIFTTVIDYAAGLLIEKAPTPLWRKAWLWMSLVSNLGFLAAFKYTAFFLDNSMALARWLGHDVPDWTLTVILPLGISFHTFQGISYTMDVYRGKIPAVHDFVDFALFVAFFPQLVAGPIVRAVDFLPQMVTPPRPTANQIVEGLHWFLIGLFKKIFIADRLAQFVDPVFAQPGLYDAATQRWAIIAYAVQIYCDFSGYTDMAIGSAKWFGFELPQNFNYPYVARSLTDFWRRWHMSLSTWLRDYLYIPLGGNRSGAFRTYVNLLITMTLCGLWHGASWNFILWGAYNGILLAVHRLWDGFATGRPALERMRQHPAYILLAMLLTLESVALGWVLFRAETWSSCWLLGRSMAGWGASGTHWVPAWVPMLVLLLACGHVFSGLRDRRCGVLELPPLLRAAAYVAATVLIVAFGPGATKAFIYFQF